MLVREGGRNIEKNIVFSYFTQGFFNFYSEELPKQNQLQILSVLISFWLKTRFWEIRKNAKKNARKSWKGSQH